MSLNRSENLEEALGHLERLLFDRFPHVYAVLRPSAAGSALDMFADEFGKDLPNEFRTLYQWHDGMDLLQAPHRTRDPLPGLGHWWPLIKLPSLCRDWQDSWQAGFSPWWIPITWMNEGTLAVDASGHPDSPATMVKVHVDGIDASAPAVHDLIDQLVGVIDAGYWSPSTQANGADGWTADPGPEFTIFHDQPADFVPPSSEPPPRFSVQRRFPQHDIGASIGEVAFSEATCRIDELIDIAVNTCGRDALLLRPIRLSLSEHRGKSVHGVRVARENLDLIGRVLAQHIDEDRWVDQFADAESLVWSSDS